MNDFNYNITERIAVLSQNKDGSKTLELNRISYGGHSAKLDLRRWNREKDTMLKGITLTDEEAAKLRDTLVHIHSI